MTASKINHLAVKRLVIDFYDHRIANLRVTAHLTADELHRRIQLKMVKFVVISDAINSDGTLRLGIQRNGSMLHRHRLVARCIVTDQRHHHVVAAFLQHTYWNKHFVAQNAVIVNHRAAKVLCLPLYVDGNHIARFGIQAFRDTANQRRHPAFNGVHHIIRRDYIRRHHVFGKVINMNFMAIGSDGKVTRRIMRGDSDVHIDIRQHMDAIVRKGR